jgi:endonuclease-8
MPEGDTVRRAATHLHEALAGTPLVAADLRVPRHATADLTGRTTIEVVARGKHLLFRFDDARTLHTHFRMDGRWDVQRPGERWRGPAHEVRAVLTTADRVVVGVRLPIVDVIATRDESRVVGHLGPDLLGPDWDPDEARRRLLADPDRTIGEALLDQRCLAGIGTIYRAETLFVTSVHPLTAVGAVADLDAVLATARRLLQRGVRAGEPLTTGDRRRPVYAYGRSRRACYRCGTPIAFAEIGTPPRGAYWCPTCQPPG